MRNMLHNAACVSSIVAAADNEPEQDPTQGAMQACAYLTPGDK